MATITEPNFPSQQCYRECIVMFLDIASEYERQRSPSSVSVDCTNFFEDTSASFEHKTMDTLLPDNSNKQINSEIKDTTNLVNQNEISKHYQRQNAIKNILRGFSRFIASLDDYSYEKLYSRLTGWRQLSEIKKYLNKQLKQKKAQWNVKLKCIISSRVTGPVFYNFLVLQYEPFIQQSKVVNLEQHHDIVRYLKELYKSGKSDSIKTYKKRN